MTMVSRHWLARLLIGILVAGAMAWVGIQPASAAYPFPGFLTGDTRAHDPVMVITSSAVPYAASRTPAFAAYPFPADVAGEAAHDPLIVSTSSAPRYVVYSTHNEARVSANRIGITKTGPAIVPTPLWWHSYAPTGLDD